LLEDDSLDYIIIKFYIYREREGWVDF